MTQQYNVLTAARAVTSRCLLPLFTLRYILAIVERHSFGWLTQRCSI